MLSRETLWLVERHTQEVVDRDYLGYVYVGSYGIYRPPIT